MSATLTSMVVPATYGSLDSVRRVLEVMLPPPVGADLRTRLGICLAEGFNNAVQHAYAETEGRIQVTIAVGASDVILEIADVGLAMSEEDRQRLLVADLPDPAALPLRELPERGLGFGILRSVLDEVGYTSRHGFNVLRMVKHFEIAEPAR